MHFTKLLSVLSFAALSAALQEDNFNVLPRLSRVGIWRNHPDPDVEALTYFPLHRIQSSRSLKSSRSVSNGGTRLSPAHATDKFGHLYYTPVTIGGKKFNLMIDTASSDTWIASPNVQCLTQDRQSPLPQSDCGFQDFYSPGKEFKPIPNQTFDIFYGSGGFARGDFGRVDVEVAGIKVNTQVAIARSANYGVTGTSGILGLAYSDITFAFAGTNTTNTSLATNQLPYNPVFTAMWKKNLVAPVFSVAYDRVNPNARANNNPDGYLALGGLPPVKTVGPWARSKILIPPLNLPFAYLDTIRPYPQYLMCPSLFEWYTIIPDAILLDSSNGNNKKPCSRNQCNQYTPLPNSTNIYLMLDGGATQAYFPPDIANAIAAAFSPPAVYDDDLGFYAVPCNAKAPSFAIKIGGVEFPVDRKDMIIDDETGRGLCQSGVNNGRNYPPYVIGGTFMKNVVTVFDIGASEMRFAARGVY